MVLRIDQLTVTDMQLEDTIDIMLKAHGQGVAAFDLKVGLDSRYVDVVEVLRGELPAECNWELFRPILVSADVSQEQPRVLWKITALAKMSADTTSPDCLTFDRPVSLARLVVTSEPFDEVPDHHAAVFFYWQDCRDNVLSNAGGNKLLVSTDVTDHLATDRAMGGSLFPTRAGTPPTCIDTRRANHPKRFVEFHNGGVTFQLDLGLEAPADST